jgi:hypothetical protein
MQFTPVRLAFLEALQNRAADVILAFVTKQCKPEVSLRGMSVAGEFLRFVPKRWGNMDAAAGNSRSLRSAEYTRR